MPKLILMTEHALVLAYTNLDDLPKNWDKFDSIDLFGSSEEVWQSMKKGNTYLRNHRKLLLNKTDLPQRDYSRVYIKHPDPFGEPRNWMLAISVIRERLQGYIDCIFWSKQEILAFNFLLINLWGTENVKFISLNITNDNGEQKFYIRWETKKILHRIYSKKYTDTIHPNVFLFHYFKAVALYLSSNISLKICKEILKKTTLTK